MKFALSSVKTTGLTPSDTHHNTLDYHQSVPIAYPPVREV